MHLAAPFATSSVRYNQLDRNLESRSRQRFLERYHSMVRRLMVLLPAFFALGQGGAPDLDLGSLASGPFSRMHMLLEKTVFRVDVLTLEVRFGQETARRLEETARGKQLSAAIADRIAEAAVDADEAYVDLEFLRGVSLDRWVQGVRESLTLGRRAGLIDEKTLLHVHRRLPEWFAVVAERGFRKGDQILYRAYPDRMRTVLISNDGRVLLDQVDKGASPGRAMLAGYFAPGTDFREPLIGSLFER